MIEKVKQTEINDLMRSDDYYKSVIAELSTRNLKLH